MYAEVLGGALTGDGYHITAPDPSGDGAVRAINRALKNSGVTAADVDLILAHGTGTVLNDQVESLAIRRVFGVEGARMPKVTSIKSMLGHALGAAGAQSALAAVRALETGMVPPTINYTPDPELGVDIVGNVAQKINPKIALVEAFGFGGQNVVVAFKKWEG